MNTDSSKYAAEVLRTAERPLVDTAFAQFERITADARKSRPDPTSIRFPGYRILGEIHRGGQGVVYQAVQDSTHRKVAIKVLKEGPFADPTELARFDREIDVLSRLNHPHIVAIHDRGLTAGHAYYVMDFIPGRPLDAYVAGEDLSIDEILRLFLKICDAVNVAHLRGVIHRDLKPGNIRIDEAGEPRILDFGLAKLAQETAGGASAQNMTITGQFIGSLPWASPEQAAGRADELDVRTDVYSLGVILYELLTRRFPYPVTGRIDDVVRHISQTIPARPSATDRRIEHDLELIVLKCLAKEPEHRYQSAGELARDLQRYLSHEPVTATSPSAAYRLRKFVRRNRGFVIAAGAIAATLVIATAVSLAFALSEARQRQAAELAGARARQAEAEEKNRADELEQVARFQESQLADIDAQSMGLKLRTGLLTKARIAAERSKLTPEQTNARIADLEELIGGSDFTGLALDALDENFFQPAVKVIGKQFAAQPLVRAQLLHSSAIALQKLGLFDASLGPQQEALEIRRRILGNEHPATLAAINDLGLLFESQGKYAEAQALMREALDTRRRVLGDDDPYTLVSIGNMGHLLQAQSKLRESEPYLREALEKCRRVFGPDSHEAFAAMSNMGTLLRAEGKFAEAEKYWREALDGFRRTLGEDDPATLIAINNIGLLMQDLRKFPEAEAYCREALEKSRRVRGDDHPDTLKAINNMARLFYSQGKFSEAEPYLREDLEKSRRLLGNDHVETLNTIGNLGLLLQAQGRLAEAEPLLREAMEKRRRLLGEDNPESIVAARGVGYLLQEQGKLAESEPLLLDALERSRRTLGNEHPDTLTAINYVGVLFYAQGNFAKAEPYYREALETRRRTRGPDHPETLGSIAGMGALLRAQGKPTEAIALLAPIEPPARRVFTAGNTLRLGRFLTALGRARVSTGELDAAESNLNEANAIVSESKRATPRDRKELSAGMVELYEALNKADPQDGYATKAAEWRAQLDKGEPHLIRPGG